MWIELGTFWASGLASIAMLPDDVGAWAPLGIWATMAWAGLSCLSGCPM